MPGIERCASLEQMPPLEPLSEPHSENSSLSGPPGLEVIREPSMQEPNRNFHQFVRDIVALLKLRLVLENKGNVARDHLASERTYLAYVRTSLACASGGIALVQLFEMDASANKSTNAIKLKHVARPLGAIIILFGLTILVFGLVRYFSTQSALVRGYFPVARNSITMLAFVLGSLVSIVFGLVVAGTQG